LYVFEFLPAYAAEFVQQIDRSFARHGLQLNECLVRLQIGIEDLANIVFRAAHNALRRQESHPAELCIEANETRNIRLAVLKCIDVALRLATKNDPPIVGFIGAKSRLRGPSGAQDEFLLAATVQNLRKLAKLIPPPAPMAA
jgi:hypothetical protein